MRGKLPMMMMGMMIISDMFNMMMNYDKLWQVGELAAVCGQVSQLVVAPPVNILAICHQCHQLVAATNTSHLLSPSLHQLGSMASPEPPIWSRRCS